MKGSGGVRICCEEDAEEELLSSPARRVINSEVEGDSDHEGAERARERARGCKHLCVSGSESVNGEATGGKTEAEVTFNLRCVDELLAAVSIMPALCERDERRRRRPGGGGGVHSLSYQPLPRDAGELSIHAVMLLLMSQRALQVQPNQNLMEQLLQQQLQ